MKPKQLLEEKREDILKIASKHGAHNIRIFGSVVRGDETKDSNIKFLVDYDINKISPWFPGGLLMDLQDLLGCKVDIATEKALSKYVKNRVLDEAKPL